MSETTKIQWCDSTWNPWRGCTTVSAGELRVLAKPATFNAPLRWNKKPWVCDRGCDLTDALRFGNECGCGGTVHRRRVMLGSLMDIFDPEVPISDFALALNVVRHCNELDWLFVTKRTEMFALRLGAACDWWAGKDAANYSWMANWMVGNPPPYNVTVIATVENQEMADKRIPELLQIPVRRRGLSIEPLLGPVDLREWLPHSANCTCGTCYTRSFRPREKGFVDWVFVGGESGPGARPCNVEWIRGIVQQCAAAGVPCFVKQWGENRTATSRADLVIADLVRDKKGSNPAEWPVDLRVRQWMEDVRASAALGGHPDSQLWGEHGLLEATMRCVRAMQEREDDGK